MAGRRLPDKQRFEILRRDDFTCHYCGRTKEDGVKLEVDHLVAYAAGGTDEPSNLVTACRECNKGKDDTPLDAPIQLGKRPPWSEIIAWHWANGANNETTGRRYGLATETIRVKMLRQGDGRAGVGEETEEIDDGPEPDINDVEGNIQKAIRLRAQYLAKPSSLRDPGQKNVVGALTGLAVHSPTASSVATPKSALVVHDLSTPEGEAALAKELDAVPARLMAEAWARRTSQ